MTLFLNADPKDFILSSMTLVVVLSVIPMGFFAARELQLHLIGLDTLSDIGMTALQACVFSLGQYLLRILLNPIGRTVIPRRPSWSREVWIAKVDRFSVAIIKLVSNSVAVFGVYALVWREAWVPPSLGGFGDTVNCWTDYIPSLAILRFYKIILGLLFSDILVHLITERGRPDFFELVLHLLVTFILLSFSYIAGFTKIGILVIMIHLICDVFVYAAKALVDTKLSGGAFAYIPLLFVHVWFRLFVFASTILKSILVEAPRTLHDVHAVWTYVSCMLALSLLLHTYWGFVILKIGLLLLTTGQSRDLQANLSSMDMRPQLQEGVPSVATSDKKVL